MILHGESGSGKTHLATALAVCACHQGRRVRFTTLAALANELQEAESRRELGRVVGRYARTEFVVLDELGYLALPEGAAELVFQVISERNERGSLIVHHQPAVRRVDQGIPRPAPREGSRRPHHPQGAHHRHRHRELAVPPRARTPTTKTSMTPRPGAAPATIATKPLALRAQAFASTVAVALQPRDQATSTPTTTRREVGPLQVSAVGPVQTAAPTAASTTRS